MQSLFPEWEKLNQAQQLRASVSALPEDMQPFGQRRAAQMMQESVTEGLPGMSGLDPQYNGAFGEVDRLEAERAQYEEKYQQRLEAFQEYARTHQGQKADADAAIEALEADHQQRMQQYDAQTNKARRAGYQSLYGDLTSIVGTFAGEQSAIYQTMFAASKGFAIADAIVSIQQGVAKALALPFPANLAAGASVAAQAAGIISTIEGTQLNLSGQAHDGIDNVPNTGTWNLERGERVIDRRTNVDLKQYLQRENGGTQQRGTAPVVNFSATINVEGKPGMSEAEAQGQARAIAGQLKPVVREVMIDEFRSGGLLSNVRPPA